MHDFAHGGAQGGHFGFAPGEQAFVECLDMRVMPDGDDMYNSARMRGDPALDKCARPRTEVPD
jgi:hypothetical protein